MEHLTQFESSNVARISYEASESLLEVEFHNGGVYQYFDIPDAIWEEFKMAPSKGEFLHRSIKGYYRYTKI